MILAHEAAGSGPALLLAHAGVADRRMWDDQVGRPSRPPPAAPTLVLVGDHDRPDIEAMADALATGIPGARRAVLPGSGHLPNLERPAAFNRLVLEFLAAAAGRPG